MNIAVLGAGAWGTALAIALCARHEVALWARDPAHCEELSRERGNRRYLPGFAFPAGLRAEPDAMRALAQCDLAIAGATVAGLRPTLRLVAAAGRPIPAIWLCKGFEAGTSYLPHQVAAEELPPDAARGVLSGPSFAQEVARGVPAAVTLAASDLEFATAMARELHGARLRIYASDDVAGVEVGGAVKNVIAIGAGISDGLGFGESARAALITRGLAELLRLGRAMGARGETLMGLSGLGDLVLTCTSRQSRNLSLGWALGEGRSLAEATAAQPAVVEGVPTAPALMLLAGRLGVELPIAAAVEAILHDGASIDATVAQLLSRPFKAEQG
jgi:glycerol-3-phosphate dehydrogenase (NAD(P)+)